MSRRSFRLNKRSFAPANRSSSIAIGLALALTLGLLAAIPVQTLAQDGGGGPRIEGPRWQLLEYRDLDGNLELVPPGISATALLWFEVVGGEGACSSYRSTYTLQKETLLLNQPEVTPRRCDAEAEAIDDAFYRNLTETASWSSDGSILELRDPVGSVLMTFTEALIPDDPTIAPWNLARIAAADGTVGPVLPGSDPRIQFLPGGRVVGDTGCGWFLGSYSTNDKIMTISDVESRFEGCTAQLRAQAETIVATFDEISDFEVLPAGLTLQDPGGITRMALVPSIPLGRRTWTPIAVLDEDGESIIEPRRLRTSSVRFAGSRADGRTVCRSYDADSLRSGLALTVFDVDGVKAPCRKKVQKGFTLSQQDVETQFLRRLEQAASHALRGSELELMDSSGTPLMTLVPQPELVGVPWVLKSMDVAPPGKQARLEPPQGGVQLTAVFETIDVVQGETGKNGYLAFYRTPAASRIEITDVETTGRTCNGRRARAPLCVQEAAFFDILQSADGFVVAHDGLSLLRGSRKIAEFVQARDLS